MSQVPRRSRFHKPRRSHYSARATASVASLALRLRSRLLVSSLFSYRRLVLGLRRYGRGSAAATLSANSPLSGSAALGWRLCLNLCVCDTGKVALGKEQRLLVRPVEIGAIYRTREVGDEHTPALAIERETDSLHQVREQNLGLLADARRDRIDGRSVHRIAAGRVTPVGPVNHPVARIDLQVDGFR